MTVFGARQPDAIRNKPRFMALILTAVLLLFLAGVAAWASVFMDDGLARLFGKPDVPVVAIKSDPAPAPTPVPTPELLATPASLPDLKNQLTDTDAAVLDALRQPQLPVPLDAAQAEARYAVTGIWQRAPKEPDVHGLIGLDDLYIASIDATNPANDAVALPGVASFATDLPLGAVASPAAAGTLFALDARGLVIPSAAGSVSPDGVVVYLGRPPIVPPPTPTRFETVPETQALTDSLPQFRPRSRPGDLNERAERTQLGGLTRTELSTLRPRLRPQVEKTEDEEDLTPTAQAVTASLAPLVRPKGFSEKVQSATTSPPNQATQVAAIAPRTVTPKIPSSASVAKQATVNNAINLRRVNLIGVYGTPSNRRALVRLPTGRYKKVKVGDTVDGGRVSAIGDAELRYQKGGRSLVLKIPSS